MKLRHINILPKVVNNVGFIVIWIFFALIYISNGHRVEKKIRKVDSLEKEINDLRRIYITEKEKYLFQSSLEELVKDLDHLEVKELNEIPVNMKKS